MGYSQDQELTTFHTETGRIPDVRNFSTLGNSPMVRDKPLGMCTFRTLKLVIGERSDAHRGSTVLTVTRLWAQEEASSHQDCPTVKRVVGNKDVGNTETRSSLTVSSAMSRSSACSPSRCRLPVHLRMAGWVHGVPRVGGGVYTQG